MLRVPLRCVVLLLSVAPLWAQNPQPVPAEVLEMLQARGRVISGQPPQAAPNAEATKKKDAKPTEKLTKFLKLKFDRRPSVTLKEWAKPEPKPLEEDEDFVKLTKEIEALEKEVAANAAKAAEAAKKAAEAAEKAAAEAKEAAEAKAAAEEKGADEKDETSDDPGAAKGEPQAAPPGEAEAGEAGEEEPAADAPAAAAEKATGAPGTELATPGLPPGVTLLAGTAPAAPAPGAAVPAPPPDPKQAELDAKKKLLETKKVDRALEDFQRDVTLGRWDRVAKFLVAMEHEGAKAYTQLLGALPQLAVQRQNRGVPPNLLEQNSFTLHDVLGIAKASPPLWVEPEPKTADAKTSGEKAPGDNPPGDNAPGDNTPDAKAPETAPPAEVKTETPEEKLANAEQAAADAAKKAAKEKEERRKARKKDLALLATIAQRALTGGHAAEELLVILRTEAGKPEGQGAFSRRDAALLLGALKRDIELGEFLPELDEASAANDREALNLLSRFHLANYAKEKKTVHLESAWRVTQAALAAGDVEEEEKVEALRRAVELAPKIREELGAVWLDESFTSRPERGMEIIATIGAQSSTGFETHSRDTAFRLKGLQLQKTAVDALLSKAPERAESWRASLNVLAQNWLSEAAHSYQFSDATSMGPYIQRDSFGNIYYRSYGSRGPRSPVTAIEPGELLKIRPDGAWVDMLDASVRPRFSTVVAELYLKVNEEEQAFPFIETLAATHPEKAKALAEEFVRVWTKNHNPNVANNRTDPYMFMYGFDQRANAIPLTRSKQERNLKDLARWIVRLGKLPIGDIDQKLIVSAFTSSHSTAEVYRLDTIEKVFGSIENLEPKTIAEMTQKMRTNLVGVWRQPNTQKTAKTRRKQQDLQREVLQGYETANRVILGALEKHPDEWRLHAALAALGHDENNYRQEVAKSSEFASRRKAALESLERAARLYAEGAPKLSVDDETTEAFELWFYASLGACDLQFVSERNQLDERQPAKIRAALAALPGEIGERHRARFANLLFTRMSSVNSAVKIRYLRAGFDIVGDHPQAHEARKVFEYYNDLITEIKLEAVIDGDDVVGSEQPFGVHVNLRHTREIERESGGFAKYLQNQNNMSYAYNYGRPLENYRDKFQEAATQALQEHFEVLSVTFNSEDVHSKATEEYGWRVTPYAYLLLKARGQEVDKIPSIRLDLDFLDTSGYAVIPVTSAPVPLDATIEPDAARPFSELEITQILDERRVEDGKLVLEVKARGKGLMPALDQILDLAPEDFDIAKIDDQGVSIAAFAEDQQSIESERLWMVSMTAKEGLAKHPDSFEFGTTSVTDAKMVRQRYADADLLAAEPVVSLDQRWGDPSPRWPWFVGLGVLLFAGAGFLFSRRRPQATAATLGRRLPEAITPFSVLGLLRDIERRNGLSESGKRDLAASIELIERHYFGEQQDAEPNLRQIAEEWLQRAG